MKKFTNKQCFDAGLNCIKRMAETDEKKRQERIKEWANPDISLEAIKDCRGAIGLWKVVDINDPGVIKIEANVRGEFDPHKHTFFSKELILALYNCLTGK